MRLQDYLTEVTKIALLEPSEERELWFGYKQQGNMESRRRLIEQYQPLVVKALSQWRAKDTILMDLVQEGTIGLIEAVENYDFERGVAFSLYAIHRIRGRMLNYLEKETKTARVSLDTPWTSEEGIPLFETMADLAPPVSEIAERNFLLAQMRTAMERLPQKERLALNCVYIEDQDPHQVASFLQITPSHLSKLQKQGIRRVRGMLSRLMNEMKK
ncbi:MAG TPA: sigma-70 family RNA polymerase sigma factor [Negativicutes bacterium]|nr:sigma-70 family RNA polymerase sigma factor [Negativicutes bacterium]